MPYKPSLRLPLPLKFIPSQIRPDDRSHIIDLEATFTYEDVNRMLNEFAEVTGSFHELGVQDNGGGDGHITQTITRRESSPFKKSSVDHIIATYRDAHNTRRILETNKEKKWIGRRARITRMHEVEVTSGSITTTFIIRNVAFQRPKDNRKAVKEIFRTLDPGATALVFVWTHRLYLQEYQQAHRIVRGETAPLPKLLCDAAYNNNKLEEMFESGGFKKENLECAWLDVSRGIGNFQRWVEQTWGQLGKPRGGWTRRDETQWNEAVQAIVQEFENNCSGMKDISKNPENGVDMAFDVCTVAATKPR